MIFQRLWAIALRNAERHKGQALAAAAAVAIGTTVLAASLLAGQAAEAGITEVAYDVLGETDEMVRTEGDLFFPQDAATDFRTNVHTQRDDLAVSNTILHPGITNTPDGLTEPNTLLIGYPPNEDGFGSFDATQGRDTLEGPGVLVNQRAADPLNLTVGDTIRLRYAQPLDPVIPTVHTYQDNLTGASAPDLPTLGLPDPTTPVDNPVTQTYTFPVDPNATRIVAILGWAPTENLTDLDLALTAPNGTTVQNTNGSTNNPDTPAILNATAQPGDWTATVSAEAAIEEPFRLYVITLRPATTLDELRQARQAFEELGPIGDRFEQLRQTRVTETHVAGLVSGDGKGGFTGEPAVFLPLDRLQTLLDRDDEVNIIRVSNPGDVKQGLHQTQDVLPTLNHALNQTQATYTDPAVDALSVETSKQDIVERAEQAGADFTRFLTTLSSFTIVAGILLVVNLFLMMGEERRVELSVMRALGMRKRHLVGAITLEGTLYSLPGVPIGAFAGLGLAWVLIEAINRFVIGPESLPIPFVVDWATIALAALAGFLITLAAVAATGLRLSRLDIASGLKDQAASASRNPKPLAATLAALGLLTSLAYLPTGFYTLLLIGPSILLAVTAWALTRRFGDRIARFAASAPLIPYGLWTITAFDEVSAAETPYLAPIRGVVLVIAAVVALLNAPGLPALLKSIARRAKRFSPASMVALAYPVRRQLRTGLTASMFALVLLVLIFFSTFFTVFEVDPAREAGGYDIYAETQLPLQSLDTWAQANLDQGAQSLDAVNTSDAMPMARVVGGNAITINEEPVNYNGPPIDWFYGVTPAFAEHNDYELVSRQDAYATDQAAYHALLDDPDNVIVSRIYDVDEAGRLGRIDGGEQLTLDLGSEDLDFTVLGAQSQQYLAGVFLDADTVRDLFPGHGTAILITVNEGDEPTQVARQLERDFQELGLNAEDIRAQALQIQQQNARFFTVLQVFLGIGLVIGVASLGLVTAKSALEREHELGVLHAMGVPETHVAASLVAEALFTALLGILPGLLIGIAAAYAGFLAFFAEAGATFSIPWSSIAILTLVSLIAALASTIPPARKAAQADTATAVRVER